MGVYQELVLACDLIKDVPQEVISVLSLVCDPTGERFEALPKPDHWFFQQPDWARIIGSETLLVPGDVIAQLFWNDAAKFYRFTLRTKVRNGNDLVAAFVHWLAPYSDTEGFVGYTRCPQTPSEIDLIHFLDDAVYYDTVSYETQLPTISHWQITKADRESAPKWLPVDFS